MCNKYCEAQTLNSIKTMQVTNHTTVLRALTGTRAKQASINDQVIDLKAQGEQSINHNESESQKPGGREQSN